VVLSRADEMTRQGSISQTSREVFRIDWTLDEPGDCSQDFAQSHNSLSAAQAHAISLLKRIPRSVYN
jgi:hypothetical protein